MTHTHDWRTNDTLSNVPQEVTFECDCGAKGKGLACIDANGKFRTIGEVKCDSVSDAAR